MQDLTVFIIKGQIIINKGFVALILRDIHVLRQSNLLRSFCVAIDWLPSAGIDGIRNLGIAIVIIRFEPVRVVRTCHGNNSVKVFSINGTVILPDFLNLQVGGTNTQVGDGVEFLPIHSTGFVREQVILAVAILIDHCILGISIGHGIISGLRLSRTDSGGLIPFANLNLCNTEATHVQ